MANTRASKLQEFFIRGGYERLSGGDKDYRTSAWQIGNHFSNDCVCVDISGRVGQVMVDKPTLVKELGIPYRDLHQLDPKLPLPYPAAIFVRDKAIVVNLESIRMLIAKDRCYVLSVHAAGHPLHCSRPPSLIDPFIKDLVARLQPMDAEESQIRSGPGAAHIDSRLPFELRAVEAALQGAAVALHNEVLSVEEHALPLVERLQKQVGTEELEFLRELKSHLRKLVTRVGNLKAALEQLLEDHQMAIMHLSNRVAADPPSTANSTPDQHLQPQRSDTPADIAVTRSSSEGRAHQRASMAWGQGYRGVSTLLRTMSALQSGAREQLPEPQDLFDVANLLDSFLMQMAFLLYRLETIQERIVGTETFVNVVLDHRRNELVALDMFVTAVMTGFAFVSMIGSIFGQNLRNGHEDDHWLFNLATFGSLTLAVCLVGAIFLWARYRRLLSVGSIGQ